MALRMFRQLSVLMATLVLGCQQSPGRVPGSSTGPSPGSFGPKEKLTLAYTSQPESTLVHIALAKGYFAENGLEIAPLAHSFGKAALKSVLDGKADVATVAETPIALAILNQEKIVVLATIVASSTNNAVIARKDRGIATPKELRGKRIAYIPGTTSEFFMDSLLTANGLQRSEVTLMGIKPEEMVEAITSGRADAVSAWNFELALLRKRLGTGASVFTDRYIYTETFNLAARKDFTRARPETVKKLLRAMIQAQAFADAHPKESQELMARSIAADVETVRAAWSDFDFDVGLDQALLISLEDETRWAAKVGLTQRTAMPNYLNYIYFDGLQAIRPESVKIQR